VIGHAFEVRATVAPADGAVNLREGQQTAMSASVDGIVTNKKGKARATGDAAGKFGPEVDAPYPATPAVPKPGQPAPAMVDDDYEAHPLTANVLNNAPPPTGLVATLTKSKDLNSTGTQLIWLDEPFVILPDDMRMQAGYKRNFFHAWVTPDLAVCEKWFTVVIEWDNTGKITTNKLTELK
jgi:hypothetical protein